MKIITPFVIVLFLLSINSFGQLNKGNWLIGGNLNFSSTNYKSDADSKSVTSLVNCSPQVGYFFADKFVSGIKVGIQRNGFKAEGTDVTSTFTDFNLGPFFRYYLLETERPFNIITEGSYQFGFELQNNSDKLNKNTILISAGPVIYFNTSVGLEFLIGYSTSKVNNYNGRNNSISIGLGFQFHLERDE